MPGILESTQTFRWRRLQLHVAPEGLAIAQRNGMTSSAEVKGVVDYKQVVNAEVVAPLARSRLGQRLHRGRATLRIQFLGGLPAWEISGVPVAEADWAAATIRGHLALLHRTTSVDFSQRIALAEIAKRVERFFVLPERATIDLVDFLLYQAVFYRASDAHFESVADGLVVRYRIDSAQHDVARLPLVWRERVLNRLRVAARISPFRGEAAQEGRLTLELADRKVDARVTCLPTLHGERVAVRLFDPLTGVLALDALGMAPTTRQKLELLLAQPQGMILWTGPSGSGKTTAMYAALRWIAERGGSRSIATVEDPIEYDLSAGNQTQVQPATGLDFATALRTILRQDPQVIMVGEIRDPETAGIAVRAGLTGHLVLSTLHARSAAGAFVRLLDIGVEPYLVSSSVTAVVAQRLVRKVCATCRGRKCDDCAQTGYRGRTGIFELLAVNDALSELVQKRAPLAEFERVARESMASRLLDDGQAKVQSGVTTVDELQRVGVVSI